MFWLRCGHITVALLFLILTLSIGVLRTVVYGSDELQPYSARYTWLANQTSHAMLGFFAMSFYWLIWVRGGNRWRVVGPFVTVLVKDFLVDTAFDLAGTSGSPVQPDFAPVLFDSLTDDLFWFSGFSLALLLIGAFHDRKAVSPVLWGGLFVLFAALAVWFGGFWVAQKDSFDRSGMPLNYTRLTYLAKAVPFAEAKPDPAAPEKPVRHPHDALREIREKAGRGEPAHVIIFGGNPKKRVDLATSIGCEYVFRPDAPGWGFSGETTVVQTSAVRLLEDGRTPAAEERSRPVSGPG